MLDGQRKRLRPILFEEFKRLLPAYKNTHEGIIFSGGEVTINDALPKYVAYAKKIGFRHIMIETNGIVLSDFCKARELKLIGANEFFLSVHAATKNVSQKITRRAMSFSNTRRALENLSVLKLKVVTNTVMNVFNYQTLPDIARFLLLFNNVKEMHFWGYLPVRAHRQKLALPYLLAIPYLDEALQMLVQDKRKVIIKYFPYCLLANNKKYFDNRQPDVVGLDPSFWKNFEKCNFNGCSNCGRECLSSCMSSELLSSLGT